MNGDRGHPAASSIVNDVLAKEIVQNSHVQINVAQNTLIVTEDRLRLCLIEHRDRLADRQGWLGPLGLCIAVGTTLSTTNFQNRLLDAATWHAIFIIGFFGSLFWSILSIIRAAKSRSIEDLINQLRPSPYCRSETVPISAPDQQNSPILISVSAPPVDDRLQCGSCGEIVVCNGDGLYCPKCTTRR